MFILLCQMETKTTINSCLRCIIVQCLHSIPFSIRRDAKVRTRSLKWFCQKSTLVHLRIEGRPALHSKFASLTNRVHIARTQTGHQSILIFTFSHTIYVKCKFLT